MKKVIFVLQPNLFGIVFAVLASLSFAFNAVTIRKAMVSGDPLDAVLVTLTVNSFVFLAAATLFHYPNLGVSKTSLLALIGAGLAGPFVGRLAYYSGIRRVGASITTPISRGSLLVSTILAILALGESVTPGHFLGIAPKPSGNRR